jgi:GNAT superfamily N-acetyltransferase
MEAHIVSKNDLSSIHALVKEVATIDVLPLLNTQGQNEFLTRVLGDIESTFDTSSYYSVKALVEGEIVGYGAIRDGNYLTHLFVSKQSQGTGVGHFILSHLLSSTDVAEVGLRSSVNAMSFYEKHGFVATGPESEFNGIRFVPMTLQIAP